MPAKVWYSPKIVHVVNAKGEREHFEQKLKQQELQGKKHTISMLCRLVWYCATHNNAYRLVSMHMFAYDNMNKSDLHFNKQRAQTIEYGKI